MTDHTPAMRPGNAGLAIAPREAPPTVRVDSSVTPGSAAPNDPRTCGFRTSARWR